MQKWMIPSNPKTYDVERFFKDYGYVDWKQHLKFQIGDIVYIYCSTPTKKVMYKTKVIKESMPFSECTYDKDYWMNPDDFDSSSSYLRVRLELLERVDRDELSLTFLKNNGLNAAPQKGIVVSDKLSEYMDKYFKLELSKKISSDSKEGTKSIFTGKIWSMNISTQDNNNESWKLFHDNSCISIDYVIDDKSIDYSQFETEEEITEYLNDDNSNRSRLIDL